MPLNAAGMKTIWRGTRGVRRSVAQPSGFRQEHRSPSASNLGLPSIKWGQTYGQKKHEQAPGFLTARRYAHEIGSFSTIQLENIHVYLKLMIDGMPSLPFSARLWPAWKAAENRVEMASGLAHRKSGS